jgi:MSHA pilin protein MshD
MTLIELVLFIVIVSVGIAGILSVLNATVWKSADPLVQKQAQALAEGLLEEIQTGFFAYCDGADSKLRYAKSTSACTGGGVDGVDPYGPEGGETRPYNAVTDYASAANSEIALSSALPNESSITAPTGYNAFVTIGPAALGDITLGSGDALLIKVRVTGPGSTQAVAEGFKARQVPQ